MIISLTTENDVWGPIILCMLIFELIAYFIIYYVHVCGGGGGGWGRGWELGDVARSHRGSAWCP